MMSQGVTIMSQCVTRMSLLPAILVYLSDITFVFGAVPSSRSVYYLHTTATTWAAARDTCERYGGQMLMVNDTADVRNDLDLLDTVLGWDNTFASLTTNVWTGLYKYGTTGNYEIRWHNCDDWISHTGLTVNQNFQNSLVSATGYCAGMAVNNLEMTATECDSRLPYICHVNDGQCWFLPVEDTSVRSAHSYKDSKGLNECAQLCRNRVNSTSTGEVNECWAFSVDSGSCTLYETSVRHLYIINRQTELKDDLNKTVYLKICAGGDITNMHPVTSASNKIPEAENCNVNSTSEAWDDGICYCDCDQPPVILEPEYLVLSTEEKVERIVKELYVDPSNTSAAQRKLTSAEDSRPSAQSLGALGIALIVLVFGGLVVLDLNVLFSHVNNRLHTGQINGQQPKVNTIKAA